VLSRIATCAITGVDAQVVHVEVDVSFSGMPFFAIVGLPDAAVKESGERVRSAIRNNGLHFPLHRTIINLAPADLRKAGPGYDLPIAVGILVASEQISSGLTEAALFVGELALDGAVVSTCAGCCRSRRTRARRR
jgi:magnesium chelatase family protein